MPARSATAATAVVATLLVHPMQSTLASYYHETFVSLCTFSALSKCAVQLRESKLRKAGISGRARMASEMRDLDEDVSSLSRTLAVRTLQLEMEYIYGCLEDEALDVAQDLQGAGYLLLRSVPVVR